MEQTFRECDLIRVDRDGAVAARDRAAIESALEVRLQGWSFSVIMRTPGSDEDLALGFLFTEGVIRGLADVAQVTQPEADLIDVRLSRSRTEILPDLLDSRRNVSMSSACGLCGRRSLASLEVHASPLPTAWAVDAEIISSLPLKLQLAQRTFAQTGGLHAAGLFDVHGCLDSSAEDVGRHNAVDKLIGAMLKAGRLPLNESLLAVSGRSSFEIVQKAFLAGVPLVAAVSAPSTLAIDLASRAGITLLGFVRDHRFNVYAHPQRVTATHPVLLRG